MEKCQGKIDFVVPWVDGNDPEWVKEFGQYSSEIGNKSDVRECRYRDWDLMRYWFRGVEKFAPWVNRVHFITCGHKPEWLNVNYPKLNFVKHSDYIPEEYLPTFNTNPIELNLHRIKGLAEQFVYFNDDLFLINNVKPERFFINGLPCDRASNRRLPARETHFSHYVIKNNSKCINASFDKRKSIADNLFKWFNIKYIRHPRAMWRTMESLCDEEFGSFGEHHLPNPFLKSMFDEVWMKHQDVLSETSSHKFRSEEDVTQWLFRGWQIASAKFHPIDVYKDGVSFDLNEKNLYKICNIVRKQKKSIICINDTPEVVSFEKAKVDLQNAFMSILPEKSSFEI